MPVYHGSCACRCPKKLDAETTSQGTGRDLKEQMPKSINMLTMLFGAAVCANCERSNIPTLESSVASGPSHILSQMIEIAEHEDISNYYTVSRLMGADAGAIRKSLENKGYYEKSLPSALIRYRKVSNNSETEFGLSVATLNDQRCIPKSMIVKSLESDFIASPYRRSPTGPTYILLTNRKIAITFTDIDYPAATCASAVYITQSSVGE